MGECRDMVFSGTQFASWLDRALFDRLLLREFPAKLEPIHVRVSALKSTTETLSVVSEVCLRESVRYPLVAPCVYWPSSDDLHAQSLPERDADMVSKPVTLTTVTNASVYLTGGRHAVHTSDGALISVNRVSSKRLADIPWRNHKHLSGTSLLLGNSAGAACYYHWMLDLLPKIGLIQQAGIDIDSIDHFLVREAVTPFQIESLEKLGIDRSRVVQTAKQPYLTCDELLLVSLDHHVNMTMHRFVPEWVNATFSVHDKSAKKNSIEKKLYIKRPTGVRRAIDNADEVENLLLGFGFKSVFMEGLTIDEQAHLFSQADVIVAQHGGALTNLVFARPGTKVVEIFGPHVYPFYYGLANLCGLEYYATLQHSDDFASLVQKDTALRRGSDENLSVSQSEDFAVDVAVLEKAISAVIA